MFPYLAVEEIFDEHRETTRGRDLDITGLSYALLEARGPQQWPFPAGASSGKARLYEDGRFPTASGRAQFLNTAYKPTAEKTDAHNPLHFNTGRLRDQWHGMSRTGRVARLYNHVEEPLLAMNRRDMERRGLHDGGIVRVTSRRGEVVVRAAVSDEMRSGQTFLPMHWGGQFMNSGGANALTLSAFDPVSKQPELKHAAVQVEKLDLPWQLVVMRKQDSGSRIQDSEKAENPHEAALEIMRRVQPLLSEFTYATVGLFGRDEPAVILRAAHAVPAADSLIAEIDRLCEFNDACSLTYVDARRGISKRIMVEGGRVTGVRLTGETAGREWLKDVMAQGVSADTVRPWVLAPISAPPVGGRSRGRIICNCVDVAEREIREVIVQGGDMPALQAKLQCGTECGSCVPELKRLIALGGKEAA